MDNDSRAELPPKCEPIPGSLLPQELYAAKAPKEKDGLTAYLAQHHFDSPPPSAASKQAPGGADNWTVFVNLSANEAVHNGGLRIDDQLQQQQLIDSTRGKPIKIIVQTTLNNNPALNGVEMRNGVPPDGPNDSMPANTSLVRYEISNGQKRLLYSGPSKGMAGDLSALLTSDPSAMNARHLALLGEAHGANLGGLEGDSGEADIDTLSSTISKALGKHGRTQLDVLELAACDMSSVQSLAGLSDVGKLIIASEEEQYMSTRLKDELAAPISQVIAKLADKPDLQPEDLGRGIIKMAGDTCKANAEARFAQGQRPVSLCATNTLGLYDSDYAPDLNDSLDTLGTALSAAVKIGKNGTVIGAIADQLPKVYADSKPSGSPNDDQHKDLKMFVDGLEQGLADGSIQDTRDGSVRRAVNSVNEIMGKLVLTHFNSARLGLGLPESLKNQGLPVQPLSGVSVFLPAPYAVEGDRLAQQRKTLLDQQLNHDEAQFECRMALADLKPAANILKSSLAGHKEYLDDMLPHVQSVDSRQHVAHFRDSTVKLMNWLGTAGSLNQHDRVSQYTTLKSHFSADLNALMEDTRAWKEMGMEEAKVRFHNDTDDGTTGWNPFLKWLATRK